MKETSQRGGPRPGAGRNAKYTEELKLSVGSLCQKLMSAAIEIQKQEAIDRLVGKTFEADRQSNLNDQWQQSVIPVKKRTEWLKSEKGIQHLSDVAIEIEELNKSINTGNPKNRIFQVKLKAPYGARKLIRKIVAEKYSLTENEVKYLWDEFIKFERKLKQEF
jgi:archaellin